ncbi:MAG: 30S ribosomal protein S16 [Candidatus Magasanikiibacteriota bacterium]
MLTLRLQRLGKTKRPSYRLIVSEKKHDTQYGSLEILGIYNPVEKNKIVELKADRIKYWLSVGAQMSETVNNILINAGVITGAKRKAVKISKKRQTKMEAEKGKAEEAKKKAEEAKLKAEEDAKAKAEAEKLAAEEKAKADAEAAKIAEETKVEETPAVEEVKTEASVETTPVVEETKVEETPAPVVEETKTDAPAESAPAVEEKPTEPAQ